MPYDPLTPARFKGLKPEFAEVEDDIVQQFLDLGARFVDTSWLEKDFETAWAAITCHLLTLEGFGTSTEAEIAQAGGSRISSLNSGSLSISFAQATGGGKSEFEDWLGETSCGRFYRVLLRLNRGGPRLLTGGSPMPSGYAKDWPWPSG